MAEITKLKTSPIDDKYWLVEEDYYYQCSLDTVLVPKGFKTDYASVPKIFRNIINSYGKPLFTTGFILKIVISILQEKKLTMYFLR